MNGDRAAVRHWSQRLGDFIPDFFEQSPAFRTLGRRCAVILHGSTTLGIDDAFSDLDVWVLVSPDALRQAESIAATRFFSFTLDGKPGHFNLEAVDEAIGRVRQCDMERIAELRQCHILTDPEGTAHDLVAMAKRPMSDSVRKTWFCHHYVEMRASHRNCDNPLERGDALAFLQGLVPTLNHSLRAAMVLDREPYPYIKWLGRAAAQTLTGRRLIPLVHEVLDLIATDALRYPGPERDHPLGKNLREIRRLLVESARAGGIDEPWLERWWVHITQAAEGIRSASW
jgi:hypothetical protein